MKPVGALSTTTGLDLYDLVDRATTAILASLRDKRQVDDPERLSRIA